jgi:hypothetical protein
VGLKWGKCVVWNLCNFLCEVSNNAKLLQLRSHRLRYHFDGFITDTCAVFKSDYFQPFLEVVTEMLNTAAVKFDVFLKFRELATQLYASQRKRGACQLLKKVIRQQVVSQNDDLFKPFQWACNLHRTVIVKLFAARKVDVLDIQASFSEHFDTSAADSTRTVNVTEMGQFAELDVYEGLFKFKMVANDLKLLKWLVVNLKHLLDIQVAQWMFKRHLLKALIMADKLDDFRWVFVLLSTQHLETMTRRLYEYSQLLAELLQCLHLCDVQKRQNVDKQLKWFLELELA